MTLEKLGTILVGLMVCGLVLLWLLIGWRHGWEFRHHLLILMAAALAVLSRKIRPVSRLSMVLVYLAVAIPLYFGDLVFAVSQYGNPRFHEAGWLKSNSGEERSDERVVVAEKEGVHYDTRTRIEVMDELHEKGIRAYPSVPPIVLIKGWPNKWEGLELSLNGEPILPLGGISNQVTVYCNEVGTYVVYRTDEHGFRNPPGLWKTNQAEIAMVGDSFVHGACVPFEASFPELTRDKYPQTLALGRDGNGPLLELATLLEYLPAIRPKVVVWVYYEGNDLSLDLQWEKTSPFLKQYLHGRAIQNLIGKQSEIDVLLVRHIEQIRSTHNFLSKVKKYGLHLVAGSDSFLEEAERVVKFDHLRTYIQQGLRPTPRNASVDAGTLPPSDSDTMLLFQEVLGVAQQTVHSWGGKLLFVYLPQWERYSGRGLISGDREGVLSIVNKLGIPVADLHPRFASDRDPLSMFPLRLRGHYSIRGNHIVYEEIQRTIDRTSMLTPHRRSFNP